MSLLTLFLALAYRSRNEYWGQCGKVVTFALSLTGRLASLSDRSLLTHRPIQTCQAG